MKKSDLITFLLCILSNPRSKTNSITTQKQAANAAQEIISKGLKKYGTDVELFKGLFVKRSREDLIQISREFRSMDKKNNKSIVAFVPGDGNIEFIDENDRVLIAGLGRKGHAVGDIPGIRFKVVHVADIGLNALFRKKKEKPKSK